MHDLLVSPEYLILMPGFKAVVFTYESAAVLTTVQPSFVS
jgi:hypothetical protein